MCDYKSVCSLRDSSVLARKHTAQKRLSLLSFYLLSYTLLQQSMTPHANEAVAIAVAGGVGRWWTGGGLRAPWHWDGWPAAAEVVEELESGVLARFVEIML